MQDTAKFKDRVLKFDESAGLMVYAFVFIFSFLNDNLTFKDKSFDESFCLGWLDSICFYSYSLFFE